MMRKSMRLSKRKRLEERVRELEQRLAQSVPGIELETVKSDLQGKIVELRRRLSESIPTAEAEAKLKKTRSRLTGKIKNSRSPNPQPRPMSSKASYPIPYRKPNLKPPSVNYNQGSQILRESFLSPYRGPKQTPSQTRQTGWKLP